jgi:hypothetical protein
MTRVTGFASTELALGGDGLRHDDGSMTRVTGFASTELSLL